MNLDWQPQLKSSDTATIVDKETGGTVATVHGLSGSAVWSRACVIAAAPELHRALTDMCIMVKKNMPESMPAHLALQLKEAEKLAQHVKDMYDKRG